MLSVAQEKRVLLVLVLLSVVVGVIGREAHLGRKLFWQDEAITALRVSPNSRESSTIAFIRSAKSSPIRTAIRRRTSAPSFGRSRTRSHSTRRSFTFSIA
jgi:hypothetical protein